MFDDTGFFKETAIHRKPDRYYKSYPRNPNFNIVIGSSQQYQQKQHWIGGRGRHDVYGLVLHGMTVFLNNSVLYNINIIVSVDGTNTDIWYLKYWTWMSVSLSVSSLWHPVVGTCWNKAPLAQSGQPAVSAAAPWKWGPQALHNRIQQVLLWKNVSRCESPDSQIILYSTIVEISIFHSIP